jgi:4-amino-4-deoxy-L-arabinose transferase-like glycosyltransferase
VNDPNDSSLPAVSPAPRRWSPASVAGLFAAWLVLQIGGLFSPGLLDDVDSIYIQIAREMLQRHDFVTPTIDGIRFFDKPPLMYWMAAASMRLFGIHDWAARLPLALGVLALLLAVYALGIRLYAHLSPSERPDRAGLYAALALATSIGPYLYTRFYIPDILIGLWMTLAVHCFIIALDRLNPTIQNETLKGTGFSPSIMPPAKEGASAPEVPGRRSPLLPMLGFAAATALSVLTKGLIGAIFPIGFVLLYLAFTKRLNLLTKLKLPAATALFLLIAAPWHILAALRNPAISMPSGLGLPTHAGWAWFYLYNEHIARFLGRRIPHDYGQVPIPLFWALLILWLVPWAAFLPATLRDHIRALRSRTPNPLREPALALLIWAGLILGFFTLSSRQEYYHLPALPTLALLVGGLLAAADRVLSPRSQPLAPDSSKPALQCLRASLFFLVPLGTLLFLVCGYFALSAPPPQPGADLNQLLSSNPEMYNLSLGHVFDLTSEAMGFFRGPLLTVALCMAALGPGSHLLRRRGRTLLANIIVAGAMCGVLLAVHEGLARFYPILGSKDLALAIDNVRQPGDLIALDGELTSGSTLLFYTGQPLHLVNGRINGPWFGSFWPDSPQIFETEDSLHTLWRGPRRVFLLTYKTDRRARDLNRFGPVMRIASSGGKTLLSNR